MKSISIDYHETGAFSPVVLSYIDQNPELRSFYAYPATPGGFGQYLSSKKPACNRTVLTQVLKQQYAHLTEGAGTSKVLGNIALLEQNDTFTVTTGHQLNIFTGPCYFIYKIATAIKLAADLKKERPDQNFVPVYWMATEDHDFEEINHTNLDGKKIKWQHSAAGATGRLSLDTIDEAVKQYTGILGSSANSLKLASLVRAAYENKNTLAEATRTLVHELFGEFGLVIIDADNRLLKQQFAPIIERDIIEQNSFREINKTSQDLADAGFSTQVNAREINFFYLEKGLRERIIFQNGSYFVLNTGLKFSEEELRQEIRSNPEKFSPNVVMRPVYEELVLPNLAYIGGGAEIVYWLQLKGVFDCYGIDFPILILRNSALISDENTQIKLYKSGLSFKDLFKDTDQLKKDWVLKYSEHDLSFDEEKEALQTIFEHIKSKATQIDPTLGPSTEAVAARLDKALNNLGKKLIRAEKRNLQTDLDKIELTKKQLFPNNGLQERVENFGLFYARYGDEFIPALINHFKPLDFKFTILY